MMFYPLTQIAHAMTLYVALFSRNIIKLMGLRKFFKNKNPTIQNNHTVRHNIKFMHPFVGDTNFIYNPFCIHLSNKKNNSLRDGATIYRKKKYLGLITFTMTHEHVFLKRRTRRSKECTKKAIHVSLSCTQTISCITS